LAQGQRAGRIRQSSRPPEIIAADITSDLEAAMEQFATIAEDMKK
jgi:hypothetical protein